MITGSMTSSRKPRMKSSSPLASISASESSPLSSDFMSSGSCRRTFLTIGAGMLRGEACEPIELGLRQLAIVGDDHEMVLHKAQHLHGEPEPLARVRVARRRVTPSFNIVSLDLAKDLFEQLAAKQIFRTRAPRDRRLELIVGHLESPPRMPPPRRRGMRAPLRRAVLSAIAAACLWGLPAAISVRMLLEMVARDVPR